MTLYGFDYFRSNLLVNIRYNLENDTEKMVFESILKGFANENNPLRFNQFCHATRGLFDLVLKRLANVSNEEIMECPWYKSFKNNQVSRLDRFKYIIFKTEGVDELISSMNDARFSNVLIKRIQRVPDLCMEKYNTLNEYTHIKEGNINLPKEDCETKAREILNILNELINLTDFADQFITIVQTLNNIEMSLFSEAIGNIYDEIDILSTHSIVEDVFVEEYTVEDIDDNRAVQITGSGSLDCVLQYGSDSERRRDDGVEIPIAFPFTFRAEFIDNQITIIDIDPDTSEFWA